jgi:transcriptional regulator with XRE-family HTH domain
MQRRNITGLQVAYWRYQNRWTQKILAARLQCLGFNISREMVATIEAGLRGVEDNWLHGFQKVFQIPLARLFPPEVQALDMKYGKQVFKPSPAPASSKKSRRKCLKLTRQPKKH